MEPTKQPSDSRYRIRTGGLIVTVEGCCRELLDPILTNAKVTVSLPVR